jgi:outer membrane protein assembly factor BamB
MSPIPIIFCPTCQTYLGPSAPSCFCGWTRPQQERLPQPGQPLWQASLGGPARGRAVLAGSLALFAWGNRQAGGGVTAFERLTGDLVWKIQSAHAVEGGLALAQDKLLFGTLGFLGQDAELRCHRLEDGTLLWRKALSGGVWSAPVTREERVYVGCEDGQVHCFDLRSGEPVSHWPMTLPTGAGRNWLCLVENNLYALTQQGNLFSLDPYSGHKTEIASLEEEIKTGLAYGQGKLFAGTFGGKVYAIHPRTHKTTLLLEGCERVVAAPCYHSGMLYVGSHDHLLHALDAHNGNEIWRQDCGRSLACSPFVENGLVFVGGNAGVVFAFDMQVGTPAWQYSLKNASPLLGSPACADGVVYIGAEDGSVHALPWHLGRYAWTAEHLTRQQKHVEAAAFFAIASELETHDLRRQEEYAEAAIQSWKSGGELILAARFRESLLGPSPEILADEYEAAGKLYKDANLLHRAAEYYEDADKWDGVKRCNQMAGRLSRAPYLSIHIVNLPPNWEAGEEGEVSFDIKNRGESVASDIRIRLTGNLTVRLWAEMSGSLAPGQSAEVVAKIVPTGPGSLVIEPHFSDANGKKWSEMRHFPFEDVKPPSITLNLQGDVGALVLDERALQNKIKIRGDAGLIHIKSVTAEGSHAPRCPKCEAELAPESRHCDKCGAQL